MTAALLLLAAIALVLACGVLVAAEFALLAADRPTVERLAENGSRSARGTLVALRSLSTQLSGVQIGITLTNLAIGLLAEPALATLFEGPLRSAGLDGEAVAGVAVAIGLIVSTLLTMLLGELLPKNLALALPIRVAGVVQGPVRLFNRSIAWPIRALNSLADAVLHRFGIEATEELSSARSADELLAVVRRSAQQGVLETDTATLVARSLGFGSRRAVDAMTPRVRVQTVAASDTVAQLLDTVAATGHSRLPVIGRDADDVVGVATVKAALAVSRAVRRSTLVADVMVAPMLVPSTLPLDDLLERMEQQRTQLAVVVDEYGGTHGVITREDLVEELVGEVDDEFDPATPARVVQDGTGWTVPASLGLDEVGAALARTLPHGPWTTVAGMVLAAAGRLPTVGDTAQVDDLAWTVLEMDGRRIRTLRADPVDTAELPGEAPDA